MIDDILELIAEKSPFAYADVKRVYDTFKSIDLIVAGVERCTVMGYSNLEIACILESSRREQNGSGV